MTPRKAKLIAALGNWVVRLLVATLRIGVDDRAGVTKGPPTPTVIWAFWHNRMFVIPHFFKRYVPHRAGGALTSASKDGEILAAFLALYDVGAIRGSSSRLGTAGLLEMKRHLSTGLDVGITPDGPRGPKYHLNPGIITLAQLTGASIVPIRVRYSKYWRLKSWDAFEIPKPFAKVEITLLPLHSVPQTETGEQFEAERARLQQIMSHGEND